VQTRMPTPETLRSLIGLLESEPQESKFEFIVEPSGDLFRTITGEDETNFYMENDSLPLDFNDIFEVNREPSSFHGKIQATLGSIFQDCLLQNIGLDNKDDIINEIIKEPATSIITSAEPVYNLHIGEVNKAKLDSQKKGFKGEQSTTCSEKTFLEHGHFLKSSNVRSQSLNDILLDDGLSVSLNVVASDAVGPDSGVGENTDPDPELCDIWNPFAEFENILSIDPRNEVGAMDECYSYDVIMKKEDMKMKPEKDDQTRRDLVVKEDGVELNAWKCRLYRARRKRKLENASLELDNLKEDNKRLKLTHDKMLSQIHKIRKYYIQSIQRGKFLTTM